jgi:hypothetical protein
MNRSPAGRIRIVLLAAALAVLGGAPAAIRASDEPPPRCCFAHPQYSGVCEVNLGRGESCADVLAYLNSPNASGKTYCGSTEIRGGWRSVVCAQPKTDDEVTGR